MALTTLQNLPKDKKIILFDGVCNLCDQSVQFIIKNDSKDIFRFVALQSELGQEILQHIGINSQVINSIILYEPGKAYYIKADAAFIIAQEMKGFYQLLSLFRYLPSWFTTFCYDFVAKNRYKWYGKKEACMIPTPQLKSKFL